MSFVCHFITVLFNRIFVLVWQINKPSSTGTLKQSKDNNTRKQNLYGDP